MLLACHGERGCSQQDCGQSSDCHEVDFLLILLHDEPPVEEIILAGKFSARHMPVAQNPWTMNFKVLQGLLEGTRETAFEAW